MVELQNRLKVTSVVVTHDLQAASQIGTRVALLHEGKIAFVGSPAELYESPQSIVQEFVAGG